MKGWPNFYHRDQVQRQMKSRQESMPAARTYGFQHSAKKIINNTHQFKISMPQKETSKAMTATITIPTLGKIYIYKWMTIRSKNSRPAEFSIGCTGQRLTTHDTVQQRESDHDHQVENTRYDDAIITGKELDRVASHVKGLLELPESVSRYDHLSHPQFRPPCCPIRSLVSL